MTQTKVNCSVKQHLPNCTRTIILIWIKLA